MGLFGEYFGYSIASCVDIAHQLVASWAAGENKSGMYRIMVYLFTTEDLLQQLHAFPKLRKWPSHGWANFQNWSSSHSAWCCCPLMGTIWRDVTATSHSNSRDQAPQVKLGKQASICAVHNMQRIWFAIDFFFCQRNDVQIQFSLTS